MEITYSFRVLRAVFSTLPGGFSYALFYVLLRRSSYKWSFYKEEALGSFVAATNHDRVGDKCLIQSPVSYYQVRRVIYAGPISMEICRVGERSGLVRVGAAVP